VHIENLPGVSVVRVMKRGAFATVRAALRGGTSVEETTAIAEPRHD
jgi:hypothetical protein